MKSALIHRADVCALRSLNVVWHTFPAFAYPALVQATH